MTASKLQETLDLYDLNGIPEADIIMSVSQNPHRLEIVADIKCGCRYKKLTPLLSCCVRGYLNKNESWTHILTLLKLGANVNATDDVCRYFINFLSRC